MSEFRKYRLEIKPLSTGGNGRGVIVPHFGAGNYYGPGIPKTGAGHRYQPQAEAMRRKRESAESSASLGCNFGSLETWVTSTGEGEEEVITNHFAIRGGIVYCGDKTFNMSRKEIAPAIGQFLSYLEIVCESNRDDDNQIILPGIKTSSVTDPSTFWKTIPWDDGPPETQYPDNDNPTISSDSSSGIGTIRVPLGKLSITNEGVVTFENAGCGDITILQCGGVLSHNERN